MSTAEAGSMAVSSQVLPESRRCKSCTGMGDGSWREAEPLSMLVGADWTVMRGALFCDAGLLQDTLEGGPSSGLERVFDEDK
jgi:hypothetical protein